MDTHNYYSDFMARKKMKEAREYFYGTLIIFGLLLIALVAVDRMVVKDIETLNQQKILTSATSTTAQTVAPIATSTN